MPPAALLSCYSRGCTSDAKICAPEDFSQCVAHLSINLKHWAGFFSVCLDVGVDRFPLELLCGGNFASPVSNCPPLFQWDGSATALYLNLWKPIISFKIVFGPVWRLQWKCSLRGGAVLYHVSKTYNSCSRFNSYVFVNVLIFECVFKLRH